MKIDRKKEVKNKNKNKWIIGGVVAFASVALIGSGFATWVIGTTTAKDTGDVNVTIDTAEKWNVTLDLTFAEGGDSIVVKEANTNYDENAVVNVTDGPVTEDMTIGIQSLLLTSGQKTSFTLTLGLKADAEDGSFSQVKATTNLVGRDTTEVSSWTYVHFETVTIDITADTSGWTQTGSTYYFDFATMLTTDDLTFTWGSYFNYSAPSVYYNALFDAGDLDASVDADLQKVVEELAAMKTAYEGKTITLEASVAPTSSTNTNTEVTE